MSAEQTSRLDPSLAEALSRLATDWNLGKVKPDKADINFADLVDIPAPAPGRPEHQSSATTASSPPNC